MKYTLHTIIICFLTFGCSNNENKKLTDKIKELQTENENLKSRVEKDQAPSQQDKNKITKNYIKGKIENLDVFIPNLIEVKQATMEYTKDYDDLYVYLNVEVKNNLNRKINSILFQLESIDCKEEELKYLSKTVSILPDSTKNFKINIHSQLVQKYRVNCLQHTPIVKVSEAILETKERYLNIENVK